MTDSIIKIKEEINLLNSEKDNRKRIMRRFYIGAAIMAAFLFAKGWLLFKSDLVPLWANILFSVSLVFQGGCLVIVIDQIILAFKIAALERKLGKVHLTFENHRLEEEPSDEPMSEAEKEELIESQHNSAEEKYGASFPTVNNFDSFKK